MNSFVGKSSHEDFARIMADRPSLLVELAESLRSQRAVLGDGVNASQYVAGMSAAYRLILTELDGLIRREYAINQAKAEYHARSARS